MPSLLHLDSSANCSRESVSRQLTALFAGIWQDRHGPAGYRYRDLAADPVPPLDNAFCALGRRAERLGLVRPAEVAGLAGTPAEKHQWALTSPLISELLAAGTVLIGAPMYNYSVPASLKAWIDRVSFPGAFTDPETGCSPAARHADSGDHRAGRHLPPRQPPAGAGSRDSLPPRVLPQARCGRREHPLHIRRADPGRADPAPGPLRASGRQFPGRGTSPGDRAGRRRQPMGGGPDGAGQQLPWPAQAATVSACVPPLTVMARFATYPQPAVSSTPARCRPGRTCRTGRCPRCPRRPR